MPKYVEYSISRAYLPREHAEFPLRRVGLEAKDFDLTKATAWVDDASFEMVRKKDSIVVKVPHARGKPKTIAVTTESGKLIGILEGDKIPEGKEI